MGNIKVGTMTFGTVEENTFNNMIYNCLDTIWTFGDVTVTETTAEGAFAKTSSNFLCDVVPTNSATFKVNGELYFRD